MLFSFSTPFYDKLTTIDQVFFLFVIVCMKKKKKKEISVFNKIQILDKYFISLDFSSPCIFSTFFCPSFFSSFDKRKIGRRGRSIIGGTVINLLEEGRRGVWSGRS